MVKTRLKRVVNSLLHRSVAISCSEGSQHNVAIRGDRMDVDPEYIHPVQAIHPSKKVRDSYDPNKNVHLKGRKRFTADLSDIKEACGAGLVLHGLKLKSE
jgi:ubiquitin-conjugating enzyme E2 Q